VHSHVGRGAGSAVLQDPNPSRGHLVYTAVSTTDVSFSAPGAASLSSQRTRSAAAWPPGRGSRGEGRARALQPQGGGHGAGGGSTVDMLVIPLYLTNAAVVVVPPQPPWRLLLPACRYLFQTSQT